MILKTALVPICRVCSAAHFCLPVGLDPADLCRLDDLTQRKLLLRSGEVLVEQGQPFRYFYLIKHGSLKSVALTADGVEKILGFHLPGELIGAEAVATHMHPNAIIALEKTELCGIPYQDFISLFGSTPSLQYRIFRLISERINCDSAVPRHADARNRLIAFLLHLHERYQRTVKIDTRVKLIYLPMSRLEIGNYLGLALETVSRTLSNLQQQSLIAVKGKQITLLQFELLSNQIM